MQNAQFYAMPWKEFKIVKAHFYRIENSILDEHNKQKKKK
jgi:hypothetical protein